MEKKLEQQGRWVHTSWQDSNAVVVTLGSPVHSNAKSTPPPVISLITCLHTAQWVTEYWWHILKRGNEEELKSGQSGQAKRFCWHVYSWLNTRKHIIIHNWWPCHGFWPLHPVMDMCCYANCCSRAPCIHTKFITLHFSISAPSLKQTT